MRFLHTSDWHLGAMEGERSLMEDQICFLDEIIGIVKEQNVDAVLIAGDVYDRSVASAAAISLYDRAMSRLCGELGVPVLMIAGNHDSAERLSSCSELLEKAGLHVVGAATREPKKVTLGNAEFYFLPWITEEKVKSLYPEEKEKISDLTDAYRVVTEHMRETFAPEKKHILLSHAFITNAETSESDRAAVIGFAAQVPAGVFAGFDYVALGHIHKSQDVNPCIRYSGCPMPYSFGNEEKQRKSVTIVDTDTMSREIIPLHPLHRRVTLVGTLEELLHPLCTPEEQNGYVRLQITDSAVGMEIISRLKEVYPSLLVISGKTYDGEISTVSVSMEEFEQMENDPGAVFRSFCREVIGEEASDHFAALFTDAVTKAMEDMQ